MPTTTEANQHDVPLAKAALCLRLGRAATYHLIFKGVLEGELRNGRWYVTQQSLDAFRESRP